MRPAGASSITKFTLNPAAREFLPTQTQAILELNSVLSNDQNSSDVAEARSAARGSKLPPHELDDQCLCCAERSALYYECRARECKHARLLKTDVLFGQCTLCVSCAIALAWLKCSSCRALQLSQGRPSARDDVVMSFAPDPSVVPMPLQIGR